MKASMVVITLGLLVTPLAAQARAGASAAERRAGSDAAGWPAGSLT